MKINNFVKGIISLLISQVLIKIFGVIYNLYLTNKTGFGDEGNAIYMSSYQIYALLLTVSSIGVPNAIAKLISEKKSLLDYENETRILKISIFIFSILGLFESIILFTFSKFLSNNILQIPETELSLKMLSPAVFFVSINSVMKGYFNGEGKIHITAKVQFYEQVIKAVLTIFFVEIISRKSNYDTLLMAAASNFATTIATFFSLIYLFIKYKKINYTCKNYSKSYYKESIKAITKKILNISFPITISSVLGNSGKNIDSVTVVRILKEIIGEESAKIKYGILSSKIDVLIAMPLSFNSALSTAMVPEISKMKTKNNLNEIIRKIKFSLNLAILVGIPCSFGMSFFSKEIFNLLFPNANDGYNLLKLSTINITFLLLIQTLNSIFEGLGNTKILFVSSLVGLICKVILNFVLIPIDGIYEKGAIIGNIVSNVLIFIILFVKLKKTIKLKTEIINNLIKSIFSSIIMVIILDKIYEKMLILNFGNLISLSVSICLAIIIYIFFMIILNFSKCLEYLKILCYKKKEN